MAKKKSKERKQELSTDEEIRQLVIARLSVLSPNTMISIGSEGSFSRDELIKSVQKGDKIGEKFEQVEMEWLRSFKEDENI